MTIASNLGFPPLGAARELKRATEGYWSGKVTREQLLATGAELRRRHWQLQRDIGVSRIPANDFSFYDRMLDTCAMVGAVPPRYGWWGKWMAADKVTREQLLATGAELRRRHWQLQRDIGVSRIPAAAA